MGFSPLKSARRPPPAEHSGAGDPEPSVAICALLGQSRVEKGKGANGLPSTLHFLVCVLHFVFKRGFVFFFNLCFELAETGLGVSDSWKLFLRVIFFKHLVLVLTCESSHSLELM